MRKFSLLMLTLVSSFNLFARESTLLDSGWRFKSGETTNAEQPGFNDGDWQAVSIPHNWGWEEAQQGKDFYRGPGWYRRDLNLGAPEAGKRYFLHFGAASLVADVYVNGERLGQHRGGFGAFGFEITTNLSATGTNVLAVRVNNQWEADIAPLSGDFSVYGGIYRPVHLIVTGGENFAVTDHGSPGVAWLQTRVTKKQAVLDATAQISNGTTQKQPLTLVASVFDTGGKLVAKSEQPIQLAAGVTAPYSLKVVVAHPHLWNGRKDPYLYKAVVELRSADGVVDSVEQPLGLRSYSVDPDKGFFLNGQPYPLHGVNKHQDRFNKGWAVSEADLDEDVRLISEMGGTVVRCAHYQHSDYLQPVRPGGHSGLGRNPAGE
jgi:beta-galactosidase